ncbi:MAG: hydroxymethylbilane synthase [Gloeomargarita sp. SKYBB_i_bin120]|nr:hydroxymethylbilane synthase [Gloeomargarita sp. SKYB120]MDW8177753.1 hydroxymethylbilane synthase [Gloeomargarita sp. SKYBB_i_bin120]
MNSVTRIGSRQSQLALIQTHWVRDELQKHYPEQAFPIVTMTTQGDKILDVALAKIGDKGLFTKELEQALLRHEVDLAVHSLKDLPTRMPEGLVLGAITQREEPRDALVLHPRWQGKTLAELPPGAVIGTSSLRRLAQLRHRFPHLTFKDIRGNLNTRLQKLDRGDYDGLILAVAGLHRMGWADRISEVLDPDISLYAVGQGALGVQCRAGDERVLALLQVVHHRETALRCWAERAFLRQLEGGCQVPIGVHSQLVGDELTLSGVVLSLDGQQRVFGTQTAKVTTEAEAQALGESLAQTLRAQGAEAILQAIFATVGRS